MIDIDTSWECIAVYGPVQYSTVQYSTVQYITTVISGSRHFSWGLQENTIVYDMISMLMSSYITVIKKIFATKKYLNILLANKVNLIIYAYI